MIIKAWHKKTKEPIELELLDTKGYKSKIRVIYKCDKCGKLKEASYEDLKHSNRIEKHICGPCSETIDPEIRKNNYKTTQKKWKEANLNYNKEWQKSHPDYSKNYYKKWIKNNPDYNEERKKRNSEYKKDYYQKNKERLKKKQRDYYQNNKEKSKVNSKKWRENNREKCKEIVKKYNRKYRLTLKGNLDSRMGLAIYNALKDKKNGRKWEKLVDFTLDDLIKHLELLFVGNMTWENRSEWHIDHIKPVSSFNYKTAEDPEFKECWSLNNLQPLWAEENCKKHAKLNWSRYE